MEHKERERHEIIDKPNIYEEAKSKYTTLHSKFTNALDEILKELIATRHLWRHSCHIYMTIYDSFVRLILKSDARLIVLSHINYIYYTAPLHAFKQSNRNTI